jgi:hypothetical protein
MRGGGATTRNQSFPSFRGSTKPSGKSRPYRPERSSWNQPSQSFDQQTSTNPFGAFDPNNQSTFSSNTNYYPSTKRSIPYEEIPNEYDGFYPKRSRTYNDGGANAQDFYPTDGSYYPSSTSSTISNYPANSTDPYSSETTNYNNQSSISQPPWNYQTEPYYDQQQYSTSESDYMNSTCRLKNLFEKFFTFLFNRLFC